MVPYTLSKRYQDSKNRTAAKSKAAALRKAKKLNSKEEGDSDSDDGDEPVSFFSHLDESRPSSSTNTSASTTCAPDVSSSHSSAWSNSSLHSQSSTALESYSSPSTSTHEVTPTPLLANSAPLAPKPFRITEPNYDPVTGIYSYGDNSTALPETQYKGYEEPSEVNQTGSTSSQPQATGGGWEQYYHQAEQDQQLTPSAEYLEAYQQQQQDQQGQGYPGQQGPLKPMPGAGPGLSIDDDVVRNYKCV